MTISSTRRRILLGLTAAAAWPAGAGRAAAAVSDPPPFVHGVASGDPDATSVVLWTRVSGAERPTIVSWEAARDEAFADAVTAGTVTTDAQRDFTVKVIARNLDPGQRYFYRFRLGSVTSRVGRTRTLPAGHIERLGIAVASCSNYAFGHFNAYDAIARDPEVEFVLHLGDYIYEYGRDGWGAAVAMALGREHQPPHEIVTLDDYRIRHAQYKGDAGARAMHAALPVIPIWDDHESTNNPWMSGAENHQADEGDWDSRRRNALRAYYEWMPIRDPGPHGMRSAYWRHFEFGDLASLITLETRHTGRSRQIEYAEHLPSLTTRDDAARFEQEVLAAPDRHMLADEMTAFLRRALADAVAADRPWRLIGNQIPLARVRVPPLHETPLAARAADPAYPAAAALAELVQLGRLQLPIYLDTWDGYPAAREEFYAACAASGVTDLLVLTGDSHAFWANRLATASGRPMGLELGTAGISSPGDFERFGSAASSLLDQRLAAHNPEVVWTDNTHRGYLRVVLERSAARADFVVVSRVDRPEYHSRVLRSDRILRQNGTLAYGLTEPA
jgi:alkaline phosphatase D